MVARVRAVVPCGDNSGETMVVRAAHRIIDGVIAAVRATATAEVNDAGVRPICDDEVEGADDIAIIRTAGTGEDLQRIDARSLRNPGAALTLTHDGALEDYAERTQDGWATILGTLARAHG